MPYRNSTTLTVLSNSDAWHDAYAILEKCCDDKKAKTTIGGKFVTGAIDPVRQIAIAIVLESFQSVLVVDADLMALRLSWIRRSSPPYSHLSKPQSGTEQIKTDR